MKSLHRFQKALAVAVLAGGITGFYAARTGWWRSASGPHSPAISAGSLPLSPGIGAAPEGAVFGHPEQELAAWLEGAWEAFSRGGGTGFHPATDAPGVLLALERLTAADLAFLIHRLDQRPESEAKRLLQEILVPEWALRDPRAALAWTRDHRPDRYREAVVALSIVNAPAAWEEWNRQFLETDDYGEPVRSIFSNWAKQDRAAALEAVLDPAATGEISASAGFYAVALPDRHQFPQAWEQAREEIAGRLLQLDGDRRIAAFSSLMNKMHERGVPARRDEMAAWLQQQPLSDRERASLLTGMTQWDAVEGNDASREAASWLWPQLPPSERGNALKEIVEYWASDDPWSSKDPDGCGKWLNELPELKPDYAPALKAFALHAAAKDPEAGLAWARRVPEPVLRDEALREVSALILKQWPHRAGELGLSASSPP